MNHVRFALFGTLGILLVGTILVVVAPPQGLAPGTEVLIAEGSSAAKVAAQLHEARVISHPRVFRAAIRLTGAAHRIQTGLYRFDKGEHLLAVIYRLLTADYQVPAVRLTFIEGSTLREIAAQTEAALPGISQSALQEAGTGFEGYLFPDTYFFQPGVGAAEVVRTLRTNFDKKIMPLLPKIEASQRTLKEVVILASLVEKEARTPEDKRIVAGILWDRLSLSMPLQVDAVFGYIFNRPTYSPSAEDLKVNSPYNTYLHRGLPPGPINNPGLESLQAAVEPTETPYLYYITGNDGRMYYAKTYAGHQANIRAHLR